MIRMIVQKRLYNYERVIFPDSEVKSDCDIVRYMRFYQQPEWQYKAKWDTYRTPVTDLTATEDEIRGKYTKDVRYEVRRAAREGIQYIVYDDLERKKDEDLIQDVIDKYYQFCDQINMLALKHNLDAEEFGKMIDLKSIIISKAKFENGWTYHVYQADGNSALLWFSFSDYRKENANKSLAGWANRGLHDFDIMYFKNKGYAVYDWGNIANEADPNQIDRFKMSFGGELRTAYCCFVGNTPKGKLLIWLREIKDKCTRK